MNPKVPHIPLLGFAPDADPTTPGVIVDCERMIPTRRGMEVAPDPRTNPYGVYTGYVNDTIRGAASLPYEPSYAYTLIGQETKIWYNNQQGGTWANVSRAGAYSTTVADGGWVFEKFGTLLLGAISSAVPLQYALPGNNFADVTNGPKAWTITQAERFVLAFNGKLNGSASVVDDAWGCSARDDAQDWTAAAATQCTYGRIVDAPGAILAAKPLGNDVIAYKARSMHIGRYTRDAEVWSWTKLPYSVGCIGKHSVVDVGGVHFFLGLDNLYRFDGARLDGLMDGKIRSWYLAKQGSSNVLNYTYTQVVYDAVREMIWVAFAEILAGDRVLLAYHIPTGNWGKHTNNSFLWLVAMPAVPLTYNYEGRLPMSLGCFKSDGKLYRVDQAYSGASSTAGQNPVPTLTTFDFGSDWRDTELRAVRPRLLSSTGTVTGTAYHRAALDASLTTGPSGARTADGKFELRQNDRWHRLKIDFAGYNEIAGLTMDFDERGAR